MAETIAETSLISLDIDKVCTPEECRLHIDYTLNINVLREKRMVAV